MRPQLQLAFAVVLTACVVFTYSAQSQSESTSKASKHQSGAENADKIRAAAPAVTQKYTLQRARDYHYGGGNADCPKCKDWYYALIVIPGGAKITSTTWLARRPTDNNHWYRCGAEARCNGRGEFADTNDARLDCIGKTACYVNRATDDAVGGYEDDIQITYQ